MTAAKATSLMENNALFNEAINTVITDTIEAFDQVPDAHPLTEQAEFNVTCPLINQIVAKANSHSDWPLVCKTAVEACQ